MRLPDSTYRNWLQHFVRCYRWNRSVIDNFHHPWPNPWTRGVVWIGPIRCCRLNLDLTLSLAFHHLSHRVPSNSDFSMIPSHLKYGNTKRLKFISSQNLFPYLTWAAATIYSIPNRPSAYHRRHCWFRHSNCVRFRRNSAKDFSAMAYCCCVRHSAAKCDNSIPTQDPFSRWRPAIVIHSLCWNAQIECTPDPTVRPVERHPFVPDTASSPCR